MALLIYIIICGQNKYHKNGIIGHLYVLITTTIPNRLDKFFEKHLPSWLLNLSPNFANNIFKYMTMLFYSCIYGFFALTFLIKSYGSFQNIFIHPYLNMFISITILPWPWIILILLNNMNPGIITKENYKDYLKIYPYDSVLYKERVSDTEGFPIVPRSHYCSFWNCRVAKYDHYCAWVAAPIGARNHKYFLAFLLTNINSSIYYIYGTFNLLRYRMKLHKIYLTSLLSIYKSIFWVLFWEPLILASLASLIITFIALTLFVIQQSVGISRNITLVEGEKISDLNKIRKREGLPAYIHVYNKGFLANWKEFFSGV